MSWREMGLVERFFIGLGAVCLLGFLAQAVFSITRTSGPWIMSLTDHLPPVQAVSAAVIGGVVAAGIRWWWS